MAQRLKIMSANDCVSFAIIEDALDDLGVTLNRYILLHNDRMSSNLFYFPDTGSIKRPSQQGLIMIICGE